MTTFESTSTTQANPYTSKLSISSVGMSLGLFLAITFTFCVAFDLLFPAYAMNSSWGALLPGFEWLSLASFIIGLIQTFLYGWYIAIVFVPIYNWFSR